MITTIAIHHPAPEHREAFLAFMHRVIAVTTGADGLQEFLAMADTTSGRLLGVARWDSLEDFQAGLSRISSLHHERVPEWTDAPDELLVLEEA